MKKSLSELKDIEERSWWEADNRVIGVTGLGAAGAAVGGSGAGLTCGAMVTGGGASRRC